MTNLHGLFDLFINLVFKMFSTFWNRGMSRNFVGTFSMHSLPMFDTVSDVKFTLFDSANVKYELQTFANSF